VGSTSSPRMTPDTPLTESSTHRGARHRTAAARFCCKSRTTSTRTQVIDFSKTWAREYYLIAGTYSTGHVPWTCRSPTHPGKHLRDRDGHHEQSLTNQRPVGYLDSWARTFQTVRAISQQGPKPHLTRSKLPAGRGSPSR